MTVMPRPRVPENSYGILQQTASQTHMDGAVEAVRALGYAVLDSCHIGAPSELQRLSNAFDSARDRYLRQHGAASLETVNEHQTVRLLMASDDAFLRLVFDTNLIAAISALIEGKFTLNQQNGIVNPSRQEYNQGAWHRDLPYQHFVSSKPLAINALYCIDDFTPANGSTFVLPASHKTERFPSAAYVRRHALQVEAKAGQFILLDCMTFHAGGFNTSERERRAINHLFTIPYIKQQIRIPGNVNATHLSAKEKEILGFDFPEAASVDDFLASRRRE